VNLTIDVNKAILEDEDLVNALAAKLAGKLEGAIGDEGCWLRGAEKIASYLDAKVSRVYAHKQIGLPVEHDGSSLVAHTRDLDAWVRAGGGKRL
jgi:hypothetical protein